MIQGNTPMTLHPVVQSPVAKRARPFKFPTELLQEVVTLTLSRYLSDVLIAPVLTKSWDAIGVLLHIDYHFRSCTLSVLNALWGGHFVDPKTRHPRNYTPKIEYLRDLAELARTNPEGVLPPTRHVLLMRSNIAPYERLGRFFVVYQATVNMSLADDRGHHLYNELPKLTMGFSALPKWLSRGRMLSEFADYVVNNLLVCVRALSFRMFVYEAAVSVNRFSENHIVTKRFETCLDDARQCMQKVCEVTSTLGRDEDDVECGVLSRDEVSKEWFETLLSEMRSLQAEGGAGGAFCNGWMLTLGVLLTSKERETYGIAG